MKAKGIQVDDIWNVTYAKAKNVATATATPADAGRLLDMDGDRGGCEADRLLLGRDGECAMVQLTSEAIIYIGALALRRHLRHWSGFAARLTRRLGFDFTFAFTK